MALVGSVSGSVLPSGCVGARRVEPLADPPGVPVRASVPRSTWALPGRPPAPAVIALVTVAATVSRAGVNGAVGAEDGAEVDPRTLGPTAYRAEVAGLFRDVRHALTTPAEISSDQ